MLQLDTIIIMTHSQGLMLHAMPLTLLHVAFLLMHPGTVPTERVELDYCNHSSIINQSIFNRVLLVEWVGISR